MHCLQHWVLCYGGRSNNHQHRFIYGLLFRLDILCSAFICYLNFCSLLSFSSGRSFPNFTTDTKPYRWLLFCLHTQKFIAGYLDSFFTTFNIYHRLTNKQVYSYFLVLNSFSSSGGFFLYFFSHINQIQVEVS